MATARKQVPMDNQRLLTVWLFVLAGLIFAGGLWGWYQYVHRSAYGVFWDAIDNNLRLTGVTRTVTQDTNGGDVQQKLQLSLGAENVARGLTTIKQPGTVVITETLGTPTDNYARYLDIQADSKPNLSGVKDVWSREALVKGAGQNQSVFAEGLFSSFPISNLRQSQRQELVQLMRQKKVYEVDYRGAKVVERAGKKGYEYTVTVNIQGYIETLKKIDQMMGLDQLTAVNIAAYEGAEPARLVVVNSIDGRQVLEVTYTGTTRKEVYSSYGARVDVQIPETNLLRSELEQKIQRIFGPVGGA